MAPPLKEGILRFRNARPDEAEHLAGMYEASWGLPISPAQLRAKMANFPEGQIVGCDRASGIPLSMINIMLTAFEIGRGFQPGYDSVTGGRTFSTHMQYSELLAALAGRQDALPVALCASIVVDRSHADNGFAAETLRYAIAFAEANGLIAAPYSAPRGFGRALEANPALDITTYLHMTKPAQALKREHAWSLLSAKKAFGISGLSAELMAGVRADYQSLGPDSLHASIEETAFGIFMARDAGRFEEVFGRQMTLEDFCLLGGRRPIDPVMRLHIENGARFIRDDAGRIGAIFPGSRPEDAAAAGYNIVLSYGYSRLFGHEFA
ncbi:MAG: hypothetical protein AB1529_04355 [Candidatus Micrarchaeota archaeon]